MPIILRQVAVMRRTAGNDPEQVRALQSLLHRYGSDGAEAMIDEWANAATAEGRATCLESLRTLSRTHDALFDMVRHTDDLRVRQGIELLDALGVALTDEAEIVRLRAVSAIVPRGAVADA